MLKFVGVPEDRLKEDELRALRAVRFSSKYQLNMDNSSFLALVGVNLSRVSTERIKDELEQDAVDTETFLGLSAHEAYPYA